MQARDEIGGATIDMEATQVSAKHWARLERDVMNTNTPWESTRTNTEIKKFVEMRTKAEFKKIDETKNVLILQRCRR